LKLNNQPHVSIIILNWNSWQDTTECLESVFKLNYNNFTVLLIDNGSENESVSKIIKWANGKEEFKIKTKLESLVFPLIPKPIEFAHIKLNYENERINDFVFPESNVNFYIIQNDTNLGFAIANNIGMKIAERYLKSDYYYLLNNDTVIDPNALTKLMEGIEKDKNIGAAQSVIYHYENPLKIANAGGKILWWGQTKYYKKIKNRNFNRISFINGCALLIKTEISKKYGFLSEKFFFGEEDFEFSMRMKQNHVKMICEADSKIYHKIAKTINQYTKIKRRLFIHGMNRLIDLRDFYSPYIWKIWKEGMLLYYFCSLLLRHHLAFTESFDLINELRHYSIKYTDVKKKTLDDIFQQSGIWKIN
jgi:GT2 family glycosyltransferase